MTQYDCSDVDSVVHALNGETYISEPKPGTDGAFTSYLSAPVWKRGIPGNEVIGSVIFYTNDSFLNNIMADIKISKSSYAYMVDRNDNVIADPTGELVESGFNPIDAAKSDSSYNSLAKVHEEMIRGKTGFSSFTKDGSYYVAYAPVEGTDGWSVAIIANKSDFLTGLLIPVTAIIIVVIIGVLISSKISKNL